MITTSPTREALFFLNRCHESLQKPMEGPAILSLSLKSSPTGWKSSGVSWRWLVSIPILPSSNPYSGVDYRVQDVLYQEGQDKEKRKENSRPEDGRVVVYLD